MRICITVSAAKIRTSPRRKSGAAPTFHDLLYTIACESPNSGLLKIAAIARPPYLNEAHATLGVSTGGWRRRDLDSAEQVAGRAKPDGNSGKD
jgi:hypothetical protein